MGGEGQILAKFLQPFFMDGLLNLVDNIWEINWITMHTIRKFWKSTDGWILTPFFSGFSFYPDKQVIAN